MTVHSLHLNLFSAAAGHGLTEEGESEADLSQWEIWVADQAVDHEPQSADDYGAWIATRAQEHGLQESDTDSTDAGVGRVGRIAAAQKLTSEAIDGGHDLKPPTAAGRGDHT